MSNTSWNLPSCSLCEFVGQQGCLGAPDRDKDWEVKKKTDWTKERRDHYTLQRAKMAPCNGCRRHSLLSCALTLHDKYLFTLSIILGPDIMHFALPRCQTLGMHQHLYPLNTFVPFFVSLYSLPFFHFFGAFMGLSLELMTLGTASARWQQSYEK